MTYSGSQVPRVLPQRVLVYSVWESFAETALPHKRWLMGAAYARAVQEGTLGNPATLAALLEASAPFLRSTGG